MRVYSDVSKTVGRTPLVKLNRFIPVSGADVYAKLEFFNPTSSVKDRIAVNMIDKAEEQGKLKPGGIIIEPTSGNTGLGLAMVAAARGYKLIITMPESMSIERRLLMKQLGAEIVLTESAQGMKGAIAKAQEISQQNINSFMPQQFENSANPETHEKFTAQEIWEDTDGKVDIIIAGVGTGGTITGLATALKKNKPGVKVIAVEPETSAVLSGSKPGKHGIQGIGAGFIPEILARNLIDEVVKVSDDAAIKAARDVALQEGILTGISAGAALVAAQKIATRSENSDKKIVVILPDTGERYLSTSLFKK